MKAAIKPKISVRQQRSKSEHDEQAEFVSWLESTFAGVKCVAVPNGANLQGTEQERSKQWRYLQEEGAKKGHPDLLIPAWKIAIEFKRANGGVISKEQSEWIDRYRSWGWDAEVCYGCEQAKKFINQFIRRMPAQAPPRSPKPKETTLIH